MPHLLVLFSILAATAGVVALTVIVQTYRRYGEGSLKWFIAFIAIDVVFVAGSALYAYFFANIRHLPEVVISFLVLIFPLMGVVAQFCIIKFSQKIIGPRLFKILMIAFVLLFGTIMLARLVMTPAPGLDIGFVQIVASDAFYRTIYFPFEIAVALTMIFKIRSHQVERKRKVVYIFGAFLVAANLVSMVELFLLDSGSISRTAYDLSYHTHVTIYYAFLIVFIGKFVRGFYGTNLVNNAEVEIFAGRVEEFQISKRESEIIELICGGKSNQEICDLLFISMPTVKGHVTNIYKKIDVKNRVGLANLFTKADV